MSACSAVATLLPWFHAASLRSHSIKINVGILTKQANITQIEKFTNFLLWRVGIHDIDINSGISDSLIRLCSDSDRVNEWMGTNEWLHVTRINDGEWCCQRGGIGRSAALSASLGSRRSQCSFSQIVSKYRLQNTPSWRGACVRDNFNSTFISTDLTSIKFMDSNYIHLYPYVDITIYFLSGPLLIKSLTRFYWCTI